MQINLGLRELHAFLVLAEQRNFTRAARRCGVSQPSLSNGIKALEYELGGKLFERSDMSLTPLGKSLRLHFESAVASVGQITKRAMAFHRRQLAQRLVAAAQREAAHDRDSGADAVVVADLISEGILHYRQ